MSDLQLIEAVKIGSTLTVKEIIEAGADVNQQDENGWTPLCWGAGKGNYETVTLLISNGADIFKVGRDMRTPYKIALAAGRKKVAQYIRQLEEQIKGGESEPSIRLYCKAYKLKELRSFTDWHEIKINPKEKMISRTNDREDISEGFSDEDIVFLHQDYSVTSFMWHNENVIYNQVTPQWVEFCISVLGFKVPDDFDLIIAKATN